MPRFEDSYVYCSRHGEYEPDASLVADEWWGTEEDDPQYEPRPAWVTDEIVADGFDETDPLNCRFIRLKATDEAGLLAAIESQLAAVLDHEPSGDDDSYDYWPSGVLLLRAMLADLADDKQREAIASRLADGIAGFELPDEVMESLDLKQ